jgi:hypothetical protein
MQGQSSTIQETPMTTYVLRNFASTPAAMQATFDRVSSKRLGLEFDPSHFVRQYIDPLTRSA